MRNYIPLFYIYVFTYSCLNPTHSGRVVPHGASENRARQACRTEAEILKWMNEWKKNNILGFKLGTEAEKIFQMPWCRMTS